MAHLECLIPRFNIQQQAWVLTYCFKEPRLYPLDPRPVVLGEEREPWSPSLRHLNHAPGENGHAWFVASRVADSGEFWWDTKHLDQSPLWESKIELGEKFFQEIIAHPVPLDMNILKAIKRSSLGLDFYL